MLRVLLLGQWHSLSDRELEHGLRVRLDFMLFCGLSIIRGIPDHATICRFRKMLVAHGLHEAVLDEVNRKLSDLGLKMENAEVAVVDATVIESAARPARVIEGVAVDRAEDGTPAKAPGGASDAPQVVESLSADPDARRLKKGKKSCYGYKGFWRTDGEGYVERVMARPANEAETLHLGAML